MLLHVVMVIIRTGGPRARVLQRVAPHLTLPRDHEIVGRVAHAVHLRNNPYVRHG